MANAMSLADIQKELGRLRDLEAALTDRALGATAEEKIRALEDAQPHVKPKTPQMAALLEAGYGFSLATAKHFIEEHKRDPHSVPYDKFEKAEAFMAAYEATPVVISKRAAWVRTRGA